jgi:hypothetical protein
MFDTEKSGQESLTKTSQRTFTANLLWTKQAK